MPDRATPATGPTAVTILGRTYHLRGDEEPEYLQQLAGLVDRRMREVAAATGTADTLKVAILAALNLADDYYKASGPGTGHVPGARLARLVARLDEVLVETEAGSSC